VKDPDTGDVVELRCTYDPETRGGSAPDGRKVSGTIHWVDAEESLPVEARLYDRLFSAPDPEVAVEDFHDDLNPNSLEILTGSRVEPSVGGSSPGTHYQFERVGYFVREADEDGHLVFNRTVTLRDTWTKRQEGASARRPRPRPRRDEKARTGPGEPPRSNAPRRETADRAASPELREKLELFRTRHGLSEEDADLLTRDMATATLFEEAVSEHDAPQPVANWIIHEVRAEGRDPGDIPFGGSELGALVALVEAGDISQPAAKRVLARMLAEGGDPRHIVEEEGLTRIADPAELEPVIRSVLEAHADQVERYQAGQEGLLGFFVGQAMRETRGLADPELLQRLLRERLA
jgi:glutaminyl-tRNA synthetase